MSLDALAPDQRAVVQLVLQQDRSYEDLAGLLRIPTEAVRERAHRGLERLAPAEGVDAPERAEIADYLLGQQTVSRREATRGLLAASQPARAWARALAAELEPVARGGLPGVPGDDGEPEPEPEPGAGPEAGEARAAEETLVAPGSAATGPEPAEPPVRARPRPRADRARPERERPAAADRDEAGPTVAGARTSRLGGALLLGAAALIVAAVVVYLVARNSNDDTSKATAKATPTATASAAPQFRVLGQIPLKAASGGDAKGQMVLFQGPQNGLAFTIQGENVPASRAGEAYAVWLTGGGSPHRLGFAPQVGQDGKLGSSGPQAKDAKEFLTWITKARRVVVSRETSDKTSAPGPVVLEGTIPRGSGTGAGGGG